MVNFRVRNRDSMASRLRSAGIAVKVDPSQYRNGRFARLKDPGANPTGLWQPGGPGCAPFGRNIR